MAGARTVVLELGQHEAVEAVTAALGEQQFGVLTTIDVAATLKAKLGVDVEDFVILGACNPTLAHQALLADPEIGLLLPCSVTVRRSAGRTLVQAVDPLQLLAAATGSGTSALSRVAREASAGLGAALDALEHSADLSGQP
jgi:uncharacterized protein (DUF302 family)